MHEYVFDFPWGEHHVLTLKEIVLNVAENTLGLEKNEWYDGYREEMISLEEFQQEVYNQCVSDSIELDLNGTVISMDTPKEVRFFGKEGIYAIASEVYKGGN